MDTIDKLIFALDGDLTPLKGKYAEVEAETSKTAAKVKATWETTLQSVGRSSGVDRSFKDAAASADVFSKALGDTNSAAKRLRDSYKETTAVVDKSHGSVNMATREFRALFDELSSGRTRMVPGTLAIIATRVFGISGATLAWGAAVAAIPAAFVLAAVQAENALSRVDKALARTAFAAGVTRDQIVGIAMGLEGSTGISMRGALDMGGILVGRDNVGGAQLPGAIRAASGLGAATGLSEDKAAAELEKMLADPAKGAAELNDQFKLLDVATTRQIEDLESSGRRSEAQRVIIDAVNARFSNLEGKTGSLASEFDSLGKKLSNFWFNTGAMMIPGGPTLQGQIAFKETQLSQLQSRPDAATSVVKDREAVLAKDLLDLFSRVAKVNISAASGGLHKAANDAIGAGLADADKESNKFAQHLRDLHNELDRDTLAVDKAKITHSQFTATLENQRKAVQTALQNQKTPEELAAQAAADQRRIAGTPLAQRPVVEAQIAAQRELQRNLANPSTALQAQSIYQQQMGVAGIVKESAMGDKEAKNLAAMQSESQAQIDLAKAYDQGSAAVARQKAIGEAHTAFVKGEISNETAYAAALQQRAFATEAVNVAQKIANDNEQIAGMRRIQAAGGDPAAIARAEVENAALAATIKERDNAVTKDQIALADKHLAQLRAELGISKELAAENAASKDVFGARQKLGFANDNYRAISSGASSDDLRHIEVAQSTFADLISKGLNPASDKFREIYQTLLPLNLQLSDMAEQTRKLQQAASDFASAITGPLDQFAMKGGSLKKLGSSILQNEAGATIKDFVIDPLQKGLTSLFGGLLGTGKPDGSVANPLYVVMAPQGMLTAGLGSGGGGLFGAGGIFGSGGMVSGIGSWIGGFFAGGGNTDPSKAYVVGEKGPEIFAPGVSGQVIPFKAPSASPSGGSGSMNIRHEMTVVVQGVGDKDLLTKIQAGTEMQMRAAFDQNNKAMREMQRPNLLKANRRALP